eukprot:GFKZ01005359.1.p1 GENE.GFKZ01005359.1~~GFKZ01005359.1.p1  ORF type:complete len:345 (-),score=30.46 GFKZ01005359.1:686-1720(-)
MGKVCRAALLVSTSLAIFVISVAFSLITWRDFQAIRTTSLPPVPCTVARSQILQTSTPPPRYTVRVTLRPPNLPNSPLKPNEQAHIAAYPSTDPSEYPFTTRQDAQQFAARFPPGQTAQCYTDGHHISLTPSLASPDQIYKHLLRTIFPIVAAALSALLTLYALYRLHLAIRMGSSIVQPPPPLLGVNRLRAVPIDDDVILDPTNLDSFALTRPPSIHPTPRKRPLTHTQAKKLMVQLRALGDVDPAGTCPICLEDFADDNGVCENAVKLPCGHEYHEHCLLQWCQKGPHLCPYCGPYCSLDVSDDDEDVDRVGRRVVGAAEVSASDARPGWWPAVDRLDLPGT